MELLAKIKEKAKKNRRKIVLPEADDERILRAAREITQQGIAQVTLLGERRRIGELASSLEVDLQGVEIRDPEGDGALEGYARRFQELRKKTDRVKMLLETDKSFAEIVDGVNEELLDIMNYSRMCVALNNMVARQSPDRRV